VTHKPSWTAGFLYRLSILLLVFTAGFGLFVVAGAILGFGAGGNDVAVHTTVDADRVDELPPGTVGPDTFDVVVRVRDASAEQLRWFAIRDLPPGIVVIVVLWLIRGLLKSVRDGDPFVARNVTRLRILAGVVLIGIPLANLLTSIFAGELAASADLVGPPLQLALPGNALLGGLAILVLSEVFAEGLRLRADLEGTV
jgi:Protein of unknown function (DUF2975)